MMLFSLMSTWMWFQIFTASALLSSNRRTEDTSDTCLSLLLIPFKERRT
jgi:hypothetical protein